MQIQRGQRGKLEEQFHINEPIEITMQTTGSAVYDYCCFGVNAADQLSDDRYMVFYNQPRSPQREITHHMDGSRAVFNAVLTQLPDTIQKLVFTVSIDGNGTMGQISQFEVTISQEGCESVVLQLAGTDFAEEKAIISFEIYQKTGWRYSAVARGFNGGLGDLLRAYGGEEETESSNSEAHNPTPVQATASAAPVTQQAIPQSQAVQQQTSPTPPPVYQQQAPMTQPVQQQNSPVIHSAIQQQTPNAQPLYQQQAVSVPPTTQSQATSAFSSQPAAQPQKKVDLLKLGNKPVNLKKNDKVELRKPNDEVLKRVVVGLGWDAAKAGMSIDCDSSVFLCQNGKLRSNNDIVAFYHLKHSSGAVIHHGDNLTGDGDGDDEQITIDLMKLPSGYDRIVIVVNIFMSFVKRQHFGKIKNCFIRLCDQKGKELCRYTLSENGEYDKKTAMIFGELLKQGETWIFHAVGQGTNDNSIEALASHFK